MKETDWGGESYEEALDKLRDDFAAYRADVEAVLRAAKRWDVERTMSLPIALEADKNLIAAVSASRVCREIREGK